METKGHPAVEIKKTILTPKAIIHQQFGSKACYTVEEVKEPIQTECPGLIPQKGPCLYQCFLQLPELSVVSGIFRKKKEAEQSAAEMALEKFLTSLHQLSGHLGAALWRKGDLCGSIPVSVIAVYDTKLFNLCKCIDPTMESNQLLVNLHIMRAATEVRGFLSASERHLWLKKQSPYPQDIAESLMMQACMLECIQVLAAKILSLMEKPIETVTLYIFAKDYYLDTIAKELGLEDASYVLISRMLISKTPSGIYKLSREAILAAELLSSFTTKTNWRGAITRAILYKFCR